MRSTFFYTGLFLIILPAFASRCALGQVETGSIAGTVTDPSGAVVAGAVVTVRNSATSEVRAARTSNSGVYAVVGLPPATYAVSVAARTFAPSVSTVEVTVGGDATLNIRLSIRAGTTNVEVVDREGGVTVETRTQEISQVVATQQLEQLPSLTRNPYDFIAVAGNVSNSDNTTANSDSGQNLGGRGVGYAINGQRESGTEILLDGVENIAILNFSVGQTIPVDAVQEYSVITNNYTAEYGRASGGVVNVTTKSGTNSLHAAAWEFNRLSAYTANTYANDAANAAAGSIVAPKGRYTRNQFGLLAGGPIFKDRLFFFESTEWTEVASAASETQEIFDPAFIAMLPANSRAYFNTFGTGAYTASAKVTTAGQLAAAGYPIGPINGTSAVPATAPVFDTVNFTAPFDAGGDSPQNTYSLMGRLDFNLSGKTRMFFRAARESVNQPLGSLFYSAYPQFDVGATQLNQSYLYSLAHTFSDRLFGNIKISFTRFNSAKTFNTALANTPSLNVTPPVDPVTSTALQLPGLENAGSGGGGLPDGGPQNTVQIEPDLSWAKGKHLLQFGGLSTYMQLNVNNAAFAQAQEQLGWTLQDSLNDLLNVAGNPNGSQLVSFEAGVAAQGKLPCAANPGFWASGSTGDLNLAPACALSTPLAPASYGRSYRYKDWAFYGQDTYQVTPRLTLNYGLRYEHYGVQHNRTPSLDSNFYPGSGANLEEQVRTGSILAAGQSSIGQMWAPSWGTLAPRTGFAYDVFGDGKTSLRGGFGISYERDFANIDTQVAFNPPATAVLTATCAPSVASCSALVTNENTPSPAYLAPVTVQMIDPHIRVAQTQFWSLSLEREVARNTMVEADYNGAHGVHLYDNHEVNMIGAGQVYLGDPLAFSQSPNCASPCLNRPNDRYSVIQMHGSEGSSSYQSLNLKIAAQNLRGTGVSLVANYTWSHSLDDLSETTSTDSLEGSYLGSYGYTNFLDPMLDWGSSDFDIRQRFVASPIWQTPWFKSGRPLAQEALGGWTLSGIFTARAGVPFSVYDFSNEYNQNQIPRLTPGTPIAHYRVGSPQAIGVNTFSALTLPLPVSFAPLNPALGISDFGPFPANMTRRNAFRGPGAWNLDMAMSKNFALTERVSMELRAEGFDVLNHHNYYVNTSTLAYAGPTTTPLQVIELKGGLGSLARGGNHDERRFGQFALRLSF